jgi:uncharacterized protein
VGSDAKKRDTRSGPSGIDLALTGNDLIVFAGFSLLVVVVPERLTPSRRVVPLPPATSSSPRWQPVRRAATRYRHTGPACAQAAGAGGDDYEQHSAEQRSYRRFGWCCGVGSRLVPDPKRSRITALTDFFYLRMRHRDAWTSASAQVVPLAQGFQALRGHKYCLLTTFRRSGDPVPTPVWFGLADGKLYFHSEATVGKVKRIRNNPRVRIAPCTVRGKPLGPPAEGRARVMAPHEGQTAEHTITANYGLFRKLYEAAGSRLPSDFIYVEVKPGAAEHRSAGNR